MSQPEFTCADCGKTFTLRPDVLERYPGWTPRLCLDCKNGKRPGASAKGPARARRAPRRKSRAREENLTRRQVLERYTGGPKSGVFTDGACTGNPGPGGWGVVHAEGGEIVAERRGHEPHTTNNRMELTALINAYEMLPPDAAETIYSDSNLCVQTINRWAAGWELRGWKRKGGPIKNLELVQRAFDLARRHPKVRLVWIRAHAGSRWNEYADSLATAYLREEE